MLWNKLPWHFWCSARTRRNTLPAQQAIMSSNLSLSVRLTSCLLFFFKCPSVHRMSQVIICFRDFKSERLTGSLCSSFHCSSTFGLVCLIEQFASKRFVFSSHWSPSKKKKKCNDTIDLCTWFNSCPRLSMQYVCCSENAPQRLFLKAILHQQFSIDFSWEMKLTFNRKGFRLMLWEHIFWADSR